MIYLSKKFSFKKLFFILLFLVLVVPISRFGYIYFKLNSIYDNSANYSLFDNEDFKFQKGINNILLVGTDGRITDDSGTRSDSMMILTIDNVNDQLKLTSLARDSYVDIPGYGYEKLTHAYAYGGINLLSETVEYNFQIDLQEYIVVDFFAFMDIIDVLGGVDIDVKEDEVRELNIYIPEGYELNKNPDKGPMQLINNSGLQKLNGYQTLAYARIRYLDSAFERDERQRDIIQALTNSLEKFPLSKYTDLVNTILPYMKTTLKPSEIVSIGSSVLRFNNLAIKQLEFPVNDGINSDGGVVDGEGWVLKFNPDSLSILHEFIFEENN